jgi:hypothetical protein
MTALPGMMGSTNGGLRALPGWVFLLLISFLH